MARDAHEMSWRAQAAKLSATWLGLGYAKAGPGTLAALTILPIHWLLQDLPRVVEIGVLAGVTAIGFWAANEVANWGDNKDPDEIVIDEAAGALLALVLAAGHGLLGDALAIALFRLFDIYKPWPIIAFERMQHKGAAIMTDDLAAGLLAGAIVSLI
jgi:phosphatidylglycerophosphatase A